MSEILSRPGLRPDGPIIAAAEVGVWNELSAARLAIEDFKRDARDEAERQRQEACRHGLAQGLAQAAQVIDHANRSVQELLDGLESRLPDFATHVVVELLGQIGPAETMAGMTRRAIRSFREDATIVCKVHPDLVDQMREILGTEVDGERLQLRPDAGQDVLGCRLETSLASIDLSLDRQIERLRRSFISALSEEA